MTVEPTVPTSPGSGTSISNAWTAAHMWWCRRATEPMHPPAGSNTQAGPPPRHDLREPTHSPPARAVPAGASVPPVWGGYPLPGTSYQTADGERFPGIGLIDVRTEAGKRRFIGDVIVDADLPDLEPSTLVGFENHSGRTYLGPKASPLGRVRMGFGNNGEDHTEGCLQGGILGTYLHGSLLPKNPHLADHLVRSALARRGIPELAPLDDAAELAAHETILARAPR